MLCTKCGAEILEGTSLCHRCGNQVNHPAQNTSAVSHKSRISAPIEGTATASLVLGLLSFFCGGIMTAIPAVICGHVGLSRIKKSGGALSGNGQAIAGMIMGYLIIFTTLLTLAAVIIAFVYFSDDQNVKRFMEMLQNFQK